jgi:hypothetical protein
VGHVRLVSDAANCRPNETAITWNQHRGPRAPRVDLMVREPDRATGPPALVVSLSATINAALRRLKSQRRIRWLSRDSKG